MSPRLEKTPRGMRFGILTSIAPGLALFAVFYVIAVATLAFTAFTDWNLQGSEFVGIDNFVRLVQDPRFHLALRNTGLLVTASLTIEVPVALAVALILARGVRGWRTIRVLLFIPNMIAPAALSLVYVFLYNPRFGILNAFLRAIGADYLAQDWLANVDTAIWAIVATRVITFGLLVILILGEIHSIPPEVHEAAQLDGAKTWQRERLITVPLIRPVLATCALLSVLYSLAYFEGAYIMTRGGPANQTMTLGLLSYFSYVRGDWGMANAIGLVMLLLGVIVVIIVRRVGRTEVSVR